MMEVLKNVTQLKVFSMVIFTLLIIISCSKDDDIIEINDREQFLGLYSVAYCGFTTAGSTYNTIITADATNTDRITFSIFGGEESIENQPYAIVNGSQIVIPYQTYGINNSHDVEGIGFISGNSLTITYTLYGSLNCTDVYTKQ